MRKKGIVIGFLLSLLAGIILGATGGIFLFPMFFPPPQPISLNEKESPRGTPPRAVALKTKIMERLVDELALTGTQKTQVEKEVNIFADELGAFHDANREKLISMFEVFKTKVAVVLSNEQIIRLDKISRGICNPPPPERRNDHAPDKQKPPEPER